MYKYRIYIKYKNLKKTQTINVGTSRKGQTSHERKKASHPFINKRKQSGYHTAPLRSAGVLGVCAE